MTGKTAMAKAKKPSGAKGVMDVTHPDKSAPSGNSKSVIINNRPLLQDPMVVPEEAKTARDEAGSGKGSVAVTTSPKVTQAAPEAPADPLPETSEAATDHPDNAAAGTSDKTATDATDAADNQTGPPAADNATPDTIPAKSDGPKPPADADAAGTGAKNDENDDSATDEPDAGEDTSQDKEPEASSDKSPAKGNKNAPPPDAAAEERAKRQAALEKLADSKKYYLPIDTVEKRRSRRFVALGVLLSLVLILAWADIALDAGIIQLGNVKPVTHFFSN
jgi:hypothetical protein